ncbi:MAG: hypothetical protein U5K43_10560 [Halofilum sp. (in: g-proteobacteria)]|nr:hypothetical protein [Halofilum sp. (in: g-proteobacteria)]
MTSDGRLSENAFRRLVRTLSAEQLRAFPAERLPDNIPLDAVAEGDDPRKQEVLDELAWNRGASELRMGVEATEMLDAQTRTALETAEGATSRGVARLRELVSEPADAGRVATTRAGERPLSAAEETARALGEQVGQLYRAIATLEQQAEIPDELAERVSRARRNAQDVLAAIEPALRRYYAIRIDAAHEEMHAKERQCRSEAGLVREIDTEILALREQLHQNAGLARRLLKGKAKRGRDADLQGRLRELIDQRNALETFIGEDDLVGWLDALVDGSLFMPAETWQARAQRARLLLYRLLNIYCAQQESAARQVAAAQTSKSRAESAADHYLASEQFVLRYFSRKRHAITAWLSGAAEEKLAQFDEIRDEIVTDYRRHARVGIE